MPSRSEFRVVEVSSEEDGHKAAELLEVGPQAKGWISAKFCIFPQVLVLALERRSSIEKIQLLNHPSLIPTKVEIHIGDVPKGREVDPKKAYFMHLGDLEMDNNKSNDHTARQMQSVEVSSGAKPCPVLFVKLVFHKNYQNKKNQYNQVALAGVNIFGQPEEDKEQSEEFDLRSDVLSPYDDLAFLMYTDTEVAQLISKLEMRKVEAVSTERFEYAKKIKSAMSELELAGQKLATLEIEKKLLAERQDYDDAKDKKTAMEEYRAKVYQELEITDLLEIQGR